MKKYLLVLLVFNIVFSFTACNKEGKNTEDVSNISTENVVSTEATETEIVETEVLESTETEVIESSTQIAFEDVTIENVDEFLASEDFVFVGFNESYKCVKDDPKYEIIDGCYKGVPLKGDTPEKSWTHMIVWTTDTGYEVKISDAYVYLAMKQDIIGTEKAIWSKDPDTNLEPSSEYMIETSKFAYGESKEKVARQAYGSVDLNALPFVATTTEKRSSFNLTDELEDYAYQWTTFNSFKNSGSYNYNILDMLYVSEDYAYIWLAGSDRPWEMERVDDCWKITICRNLNELDWHGLLTCLKNVEPDAESVYAAIYEQFYNGCDWILDYDGWYDIPNSNSQIMVPSRNGSGDIIYKIK